ncbi:hypothetical protein ACT4MK_16155 [Bradyrhizobium barranii]
MLHLGLGALAHANWHANYHSFENDSWPELSVLQAAHAAEILVKARIAQQHPLLIFEHLPKPPTQKTKLTLEHLLQDGRTYQYGELPDRLWAATGVQIPNLALYRSFGRLRNSIQHFTSPKKDVSKDAIEFIYGVIDPFIHQCWKLFAIDYNEDHEPYTYLVSGLIRRGVPFLVSPGLIGSLDGIDMEWPSGNSQYKKLMLGRLESLRTHKQI